MHDNTVKIECKYCKEQTGLHIEHGVIKVGGVYLIISCELCSMPMLLQLADKDGNLKPHGYIL